MWFRQTARLLTVLHLERGRGSEFNSIAIYNNVYILTNTLRWSCIVCNQRFADTGELLHPPVNRGREGMEGEVIQVLCIYRIP